ncbi:MAG: MotA/TolQ/ExbB proton channel family protein [Mariniphaga sp.]|nr:MotA/TolQ/ExbB proton channel family protein [Mariniphaga sp.]
MDLDKADTGFGYMLEAYKIGGPYMHVITILGILMLAISVGKIAELVKKTPVNLKWLDLIRMAGLVALAVGFMSQIIGIVQALEAIREAGDISPQLVMAGATISFYAPIWGFMVFIFSMLFYFILKEIITSKRSD